MTSVAPMTGTSERYAALAEVADAAAAALVLANTATFWLSRMLSIVFW